MHTEDGYQTIIGDRGIRLSGGQRQRLSIARAVFKDPSILILDEATANLDSEIERKILNNLKSLGKTIIFASHSAIVPEFRTDEWPIGTP